MPSFEWAPGMDVIDELEGEENLLDGAESSIVELTLEIEPTAEKEVSLEIDDQVLNIRLAYKIENYLLLMEEM